MKSSPQKLKLPKYLPLIFLFFASGAIFLLGIFAGKNLPKTINGIWFEKFTEDIP